MSRAVAPSARSRRLRCVTVPTSAEQAGPGGDPPDDGYRDFPLPAFGSRPGVTHEQVTDICKRWLVAEVEVVRRMMRRIVGRDPDAQEEAASITAVYYLQAVHNGNGIARFVRHHLEGREAIDEPKAVFLATITLHRRDTLRWLITNGESGEPLPPDDLEERAARRVQALGGAGRDPDRCLLIRGELLDLGERPEVPAGSGTLVDTRLNELESMCVEALRRHGAIAGLTDRQRLPFLLRIDPLNVDDRTELEFEQIVPLSGILGKLLTAANLRRALREAIVRLRLHHAELKEELRHG